MAKEGLGRLSKDLLSRELKQALNEARNVFVTSFSQVEVNALNELRKILRKNNVRLLVVKNSIARRFLQYSPYQDLGPYLEGSCGLGITREDGPKVSKLLTTFAEEQPGIVIQAAWVEGQIFSKEMIKVLAALPSREELLAKMVGGLRSPLVGLVRVLSGALAGLVNVLHEIRKSKDKTF